MKKLALLQLLLLPIASLADVTSASEGPTHACAGQVDQRHLLAAAWETCEVAGVELGQRLIGAAYAQGWQHSHGRLHVGR